MKMKRILSAIFLVLAVLFAFGSCQVDDEGNSGAGQGENGENSEEAVFYSIRWIDENGNEISLASVKEGEVPSCDYIVKDTAEWDYTLEGWAVSQGADKLQTIPQATEDATYYAVVSKVKQKYTVTFHSNGGSDVAAQTVEYGNKATLPETPVYEGYKFMGWAMDEGGEQAVDFNAQVTENVEYYAIWNTVIDAKSLLKILLDGYLCDPFAYLPHSMQSEFRANLVNKEDLIANYTNFVDVEDILCGFGEQWHMVLENLAQSQIFFTALKVVDGLASSSIIVFNNYFDQNPSETAHHAFKDGIYSVTIHVDGETVSYVVDYSATIPTLGEQTVQIALAMDIASGEKNVRVQLGNANALAYKIGDDCYELALNLLGVRTAFLSIERDNEGVTRGKIYEYLTVSSVEVDSCAEFVIDEDYASVVGNKADGMVGFAGYICELYDARTGKLIGYEVKETLSKIVYNTLWFNLKDISGINSVKYLLGQGNESDKIYVNGSNKLWETKKVGGFDPKMLSRRFDIEMRTQYVYSYDEENETYVEHKIELPMLFVQEENSDALIADVKETNGITVSVNISSEEIEKLLDDYDNLLPEFEDNKNALTSEVIIAYIGNKVEF